MKVALYCRVSTHQQTNQAQKACLIEYVKNKNLEYDIFEEEESSRKTRPIKQQLLSKLRAGEYSAVYIYKLDRWARSSTELILEITELNKKNIGFISISDNLDFTTAAGKLMFQILACFAEFERSLISERTRESLKRKKEIENVTLGRKPGTKDKKKRDNKNYLIREMKKRKAKDEARGIFLPIENYIK